MRSLASRLRAHAPLDGANATCLDGLFVVRRDHRAAPTSAVHSPGLFLVAQLSRELTRVFDASPSSYIPR